MLNQVYIAGGVVALAITGLVGSNFLYDLGVPGPLARRVAPILGGVAYLVAILWLDVQTAVGVAGALTLSIIVLRLGFRRGLRGVKGSRSSQNWAEVTYPVAGTLSLVIGWGLLDNKWLAFLPVAFMAWGDSTAGLARDTIWRDHIASIWPSLAMLGICLGVATFFKTFWIGAVGAVVATAAERFRPGFLSVWDDNLNLVTASLAVISILSSISL
jgi:dolichol kinase